MSNVPSASSSDDLLRARAFAVRLTSPAPGARPSAQAPEGYVQFRRETAPAVPVVSATSALLVAAPAPARPEPVEPHPSPATPAPFVLEVGETRSRRVERLLSWVGEVCEAPVVLLMDSYALLVGLRGPLAEEQAEGIGAHLMVALQTAGRMGPDGTASSTIAVAFGERWLTGFRATLQGDEAVTFGVLGERIPGLSTRLLVAESARKVL